MSGYFIMPPVVNILMCIKPAVHLSIVDEQMLYQLVNRISPVLNMSLVAHHDIYRAFLQFKDETFSKKVCEVLNGKETDIGICESVEVCHTSVTYERSAIEFACLYKRATVSHEVRSRSSSSVGEQKPQNCLFEKIDKDNGFSIKIDEIGKNKYHENNNRSTMEGDLDKHSDIILKKSCNDIATPVYSIVVTHPDAEYLNVKLIKRVFRRYGRIINLNYDSRRLSWTIQFGLETSVKKILRGIEGGKVFGYTLVKDNVSLPSKVIKSQEEDYDCIFENKITSKPINDSQACEARFLVFELKHANLEKIFKLASSIYTPISAVIGFDARSHRQYCYTEYKYMYQAAETMIAVTLRNKDLRCTLESKSKVL